MNTIDDLRATLAGHADLHDDYLTDRVRAVNGRVRAVRRRRAAVAGGTAAVVLAGVVGGVAILDRPDPTNDNLLVGAAVPATLTSTGYTYDFVDGEESGEGEHTLRVEVPESDVPRLVSWATEGDDQRVKVSARWGEDFVSGRDDFRDFVVIPEDQSGWVKVRADSRVALATYELGDERPAGYTKGDITFRQYREGSELVGAVIGDRGDTSVSLTLTVPEGRLFITDVCQATGSDDLGNGPWNEMTVNGEPATGSSCGSVDDGFIDAGGSGWSHNGRLVTDGGTLKPGDEVTLSSTLTENHRTSDPIEDPDALLGIAVYLEPEARIVAGWPADPIKEFDGHTWALTAVEETALPRDDWSVPVPDSDERLLVGMAHRDIGADSIVIEVDGDDWGTIRGTRSGSGIDGVLPPGAERVGFRTDADAGQAALLFYELVE